MSRCTLVAGQRKGSDRVLQDCDIGPRERAIVVSKHDRHLRHRLDCLSQRAPRAENVGFAAMISAIEGGCIAGG